MTEVTQAGAALQDQQQVLKELPPHLLKQFSDMLVMLPETESDGGAGILEAILNAVDVKATNKIWEGRDLGEYKDKVIIVESATYSRSAYKGGLGAFLVCKVVVEETGEAVTITTGSMSVVGQIVKAYANDELPLRCIPRVADQPSQAGFYPQHLEVAEKQPGR